MEIKDCEGFYYLNKILDELAIITNKSKKCSYLFSILGGFISLIAAVLEGHGLMPVVLRTWHKYQISLAKKVTLAQFHS